MKTKILVLALFALLTACGKKSDTTTGCDSCKPPEKPVVYFSM